jgi:hypothetical protein
MSLLSGATAWTNDDAQPKKRVSTMRKSLKSAPEVSTENTYTSITTITDTNNYSNTSAPNVGIQQLHIENENKTGRINELIQRITQENDGNKLADFQPLDNPILNQRKEPTVQTEHISYKQEDILPSSAVLPTINVPSARNANNSFVSNDNHLGNYSNYRAVYDGQTQPYYAKMKALTPDNMNDNRLLEKINYMIHLLEEQKNERTNNITEEFILYIFLGVFMIFTVDSFTRAGKYVR